jgi:hypothetical protein
VIVILVLILAGTWWFLHEDPEAEVRDAHQELTRLLSKSEGDTTGTMLVDARRLQGLFAESCEVTGDAEMLVGSYTREDMVSTVIQVQALFTSIDLTFHELVVDFPTSDDALVNFTAVLVGRSTATGGEEAAETREVVTRLRKVEGAWLFSEFRLAKVIEN